MDRRGREVILLGAQGLVTDRDGWISCALLRSCWSMSNPSVAAVMLVNGRPEMTARAVRSFDAQTYDARQLMIYDTTPGGPSGGHDGGNIYHLWGGDKVRSIGELRNE